MSGDLKYEIEAVVVYRPSEGAIDRALNLQSCADDYLRY